MMEVAGLVIAGVTAMGTLVQAYYAARDANKPVSQTKIRQAKKRASEPLKRGQKKVAKVIDPDLLKALQRKIDSQNERLIHALSSHQVSENEKAKEVEAARLEICYFLKQVLKFNNGVLPTKRLQKLWTSNRCGK